MSDTNYGDWYDELDDVPTGDIIAFSALIV